MVINYLHNEYRQKEQQTRKKSNYMSKKVEIIVKSGFQSSQPFYGYDKYQNN